MSQVPFKTMGFEKVQLLRGPNVLKENIFNLHSQNYILCRLGPKVNVPVLLTGAQESWALS